MSESSSIFDNIRVKPKETPAKSASAEKPGCEWRDCELEGTHRAPKGRGKEGEFFLFCVKHVREYNKSYNYFQGMDDRQVKSYHKDAVTGHRPTWKMGVNKSTRESQGRRPGEWKDGNRPDMNGDAQDSSSNFKRRHLVEAQKHAFEILKLNYDADETEIKTRYKELVKRHHPDANGGDSSFEDRLRQIIQAYNVLKKAGFC